MRRPGDIDEQVPEQRVDLPGLWPLVEPRQRELELVQRFVPGFVCTTTWAQGVRKAIGWFQADPGRQAIDAEANKAWDKIIAAYMRAFPA